MKKAFILASLVLLSTGCALLNELTAFTKCEFSFHSVEDPVISGVQVSAVRSFTDFGWMDGQRILADILRGTLPFAITANVEVRNPGPAGAAVNSVQWIAFLDNMEIGSGTLERRIEIAPNGGRSMMPVRIEADLFEFLEGENPRSMVNFALNLMDAGGQPSHLSLKIKPSVLIGGQSVYYPGFFTIDREFSSGGQSISTE